MNKTTTNGHFEETCPTCPRSQTAMPEIEAETAELLIDCGHGRVRRLNARTLIEGMADDFGDRHWGDEDHDGYYDGWESRNLERK